MAAQACVGRGTVAAAFFLAVWAAARGWHIGVLQTKIVEEALVFARPLVLIMELAALIPCSAQGDLDVLARELIIDEVLRKR